MISRTLDLNAAQTALYARQGAFAEFARLLIADNRTTNLTRIETPEAIENRHFLDSLAALDVLDAAAARRCGDFSLIDVGSGAGFPGLAIAIVRPQWTIVSLEATEKKARFQRQVCQALGLENVRVLHGRAELKAHEPDLRQRFDAAAARAVAGLDVLAELTMAFVRIGGLGVFWKGPQVRDEINLAAPAFACMGAELTEVFDYALPQGEATLYLAVSRKQSASPSGHPRPHFSAIKKRPLH